MPASLAIAGRASGHGGHGLQLTKTEEIKFLVPVIYDNYMGTGKNYTLEKCSDFSKIKDSDFIIICVPTPLKKKRTPDLSFIKNAISKIKPY